jgi:hypothetical protein
MECSRWADFTVARPATPVLLPLVFSIAVIIIRNSGIITISILYRRCINGDRQNTNGNNTGVAGYDNSDREY